MQCRICNVTGIQLCYAIGSGVRDGNLGYEIAKDVLRHNGSRAIGKARRVSTLEGLAAVTVRGLAAAHALAGIACHALACGLEGDPVTLQKVAVGYAYPESLSVMAAVSSARISGKLDRTIRIGAQTPEQLQMANLRIRAALWKLHARLASGAPGDAPTIAIVLLEPMLWSRIATTNGAPELTIHVDGPAADDVVAVTEEVVIAAINEGMLSAGEALSMGFIRLYGNDRDVASTGAWLKASDAINKGSGS